MVEGLLEFDDWLDKCPVCKEIVTVEEWPRNFADISPDKDPLLVRYVEVQRI